MIAIALAGAYEARLQSPSSLLKSGLKMASSLIAGCVSNKVTEIGGMRQVMVRTNFRFQQQFQKWRDSNSSRWIEIVTDRSHSDEEPNAVVSLTETTSEIGG